MRKLSGFLALLLIVASCASVTVNSKEKTAPPGQVKKITGSQSARAYAPGQQKKKK